MNAPETGLYRPLVLSLAVFLLASGALLSIQMISAVVGPFRIADIGARDPSVVVALWRPLGSASGAMLRGALGHELVASGRVAREVTALAGLDPAYVGAIVLSEPHALTAGDIAALDDYLESGGGVVLLGYVAVRNPDETWRGYELMQRLLGAQIVELAENQARSLRADRRGPLSSALGPREQIGVSAAPGAPGALADETELRWVGETGEPGPAATIRRTRGKGRLAWIAVPPDRAGPREHARSRAHGLLQAAVAWVSRTPTVEVLPWPRGAAFASVVQIDELGARGADAPAFWRDEIESARHDAGVAELVVPRESAARDRLMPALEKLLGEVKRNGWVATRPELSSWTRARMVVDASVRRTGPRRLMVEVTNRGAALEGLSLRVHLNEPVLGARVEGTTVGQDDAHARLGPDGEALDLALPSLAASSSSAYSLDIEAESLGAGSGDER